MKKGIKKGLAGLADGALGTDFVNMFDKDGDGTATLGEILKTLTDWKSIDAGKLLKLLVSLGTTAYTAIGLLF